jgi:hypothetical protein
LLNCLFIWRGEQNIRAEIRHKVLVATKGVLPAEGGGAGMPVSVHDRVGDDGVEKHKSPAQKHADAVLLGAEAEIISAEAEKDRTSMKRLKIEKEHDMQLLQHKLDEVKEERKHAIELLKAQAAIELNKAQAFAANETAKAAVARAEVDRSQFELLREMLKQHSK